MKLFIPFTLLLLISGSLRSQILSPSVISSYGSFSGNSNVSLSTTVGEVFTVFLSGNNNILSQGFHQPDLLVITSKWEEQSNNIDILIFPNPTGGIVNVYLTGETLGVTNLSVFDITGKVLYLDKVFINGNTQVDLSRYPQGSYIFSFMNEEGWCLSTHKILKLN